ncbi:bag family molecular chaperone regulator 8 chloroplastic, partial [Phtheirospermum japonicum]
WPRTTTSATTPPPRATATAALHTPNATTTLRHPLRRIATHFTTRHLSPTSIPPKTHLPNSHQTHLHTQERYLEEEIETQHTIASLLRRISTLESALRGRSSSSSSYSLRAAAARTIQTHFRAFLLRRSRTLRQLKDLASIKSALSYLKSSVCKQTHFDYDAVYHQARALVLKLDTIKGGDPMIRDGKSSVSRELNKFLDFIDGFYIDRRYERVNVRNRVPNGERKLGNAKCGGLKSASMEKLRGLVERIDKLAEELEEEDESEVIKSPGDGFIKKHCVAGNNKGVLVKQVCLVQPKVKKSVSFADSDGKVYRVLRRNSEPIEDEDEDDDDDVSTGRVNLVSRDFEDDFCREVEEIGFGSKEGDDDDEVEARSGNGSDDEKGLRSNYMRSGGNFETNRYDQDEDDNIAFLAPLPPKMEKRASLIDNLTRGRN